MLTDYGYDIYGNLLQMECKQMQVNKPTDRSRESMRIRTHLMISTNHDQSHCLQTAASLPAAAGSDCDHMKHSLNKLLLTVC